MKPSIDNPNNWERITPTNNPISNKSTLLSWHIKKEFWQNISEQCVNWTSEDDYIHEKHIIENEDTLNGLAETLTKNYQQERKQGGCDDEIAFQKSILPMIAYLSSQTMNKGNYDPWIRWVYGIKKTISSGITKLRNIWNSEQENPKTLRKLQGKESNHTLICIDAARFIASLLSLCSIPCHIIVTQGKKLPHAFNIFQNPDTEEFYAVTTDAVGHFPKISHAPTISQLLDNFESWQIINSRAQGITEFIFLDTSGHKVGSYRTDTQRWIHPSNKNMISTIHTANHQTIFSIEKTSPEKIHMIGSNTQIQTRNTQNITRIIPNKHHSHILHPQDTKYSRGTGAILKGKYDMSIQRNITEWTGIFLWTELQSHTVADRTGTSLPHIHIQNIIWVETKKTNNMKHLSLKSFIEWTSKSWNTLQNFWYILNALTIEWDIHPIIQGILFKTKLRVERTGGFQITWNLKKQIFSEILSANITGTFEQYALGKFWKEHIFFLQVSLAGKISALLNFQATIQIKKHTNKK